MFREFVRDATRFDDRRRDGCAGVKLETHKYIACLLLIFFRPPLFYRECRSELAS